MISAASRRALDRYALASRELSAASGERSAREAGSSVEFHDFRPYQPGDDLRAVDWRAYARSRRVITRLYRAERTIDLHLLLDVSASMGLGGKLDYARILAQLLTYVGQRDALTRVHTTAGGVSPLAQGRAGLGRAWSLIEEAEVSPVGSGPVAGVRTFALNLPRVRGAALAVVISDLFDGEAWRAALVALRARGLDAVFVQVLAEEDLHPPEGHFEVIDVEGEGRRQVGPDEVRAYRAAVQRFLRRTRATLAQAGFRHALVRVPLGVREPAAFERAGLAALRRARLLVPR